MEGSLARLNQRKAHFCFSRKRRCASRFLERRSSFLLLRFSPTPGPRPRRAPLRPEVAEGPPSTVGEGACEPRLPAPAQHVLRTHHASRRPVPPPSSQCTQAQQRQSAASAAHIDGEGYWLPHMWLRAGISGSRVMREAEDTKGWKVPELCGVEGATSILRLPWWATGGRAPVEALVVLRP